jgi:hypothetical protein
MRHGFVIEEQSCPRCANRRTVRVADGSSFCFNCRLQWSVQDAAGGPAARGAAASGRQPEPFGLAEQARLTIYRAAVRAGFYSDWPAEHAPRLRTWCAVTGRGASACNEQPASR